MNPPAAAANPAATLARFSILRRALLGRLRFVLPFAAGGLLLWWSWGRLAPVLGEAGRLARQAHQLNRQVEQFDAAWRQAETDSLASRYAAVRERLVGGEAELSSWMQELHEAAAELGLKVRAESGVIEKQTVSGQQLTLVPMRLDVRPSASGNFGETAYRRLLRFCQWISIQLRRAEVTELLVSGSDGGVIRAGISLRLWAMPSGL